MVLHCTLKWLVYNGPFVPLPSPFQKTMVNRVYPMHPLYWIFKKKNDKNTFSNGLYQIDHFHFVSPKLSSFYGNNFDSFQTLLYPVLARIQVAAHRVHVLGLGSGSQRCCRPNLFRNLDDRSMCSAHVEESDHFEA